MSRAAPHPSLADFAASWREEGAVRPVWAVHTGHPLGIAEAGALRHRLEDVLETVVALQRAEWLEDGLYVGPRARPELYRDVLDCARRLRIAVPPVVISGCTMSRQGIFGTDARGALRLSTYFFNSASIAERRFLIGRLCGHVALRQVTWMSCYGLLVDQGGLKAVARRSLGPALEALLAPISFGARLALSRWHRAAELSADRAGLLCAGEIEGAGLALLRLSQGGRPRVEVQAYLDQLRHQRGGHSPGRWAELLSDTPWTHKRIQALELFRRSRMWVELGGEAAEGTLLSAGELARRSASLLRVS